MSITNDEQEQMFRSWQCDDNGWKLPKSLSEWVDANKDALKAELRTVISENIKSGTYKMALPRMPGCVKNPVLAEYSSEYRIYSTFTHMVRWWRFVCKARPTIRIHQMFTTRGEMHISKSVERKEQSNGKCVLCKKRKRAHRRVKCHQCLDYIWQSQIIESGINE